MLNTTLQPSKPLFPAVLSRYHRQHARQKQPLLMCTAVLRLMQYISTNHNTPIKGGLSGNYRTARWWLDVPKNWSLYKDLTARRAENFEMDSGKNTDFCLFDGLGASQACCMYWSLKCCFPRI